MKVLVTGSKGFLGSWLVDDLRIAGHEVIGLSRSEANLLNKDEALQQIRRVNPDCIVHAAGLVGGIQENTENNFGFLLNNMIIGANVVSAAVDSGVAKLINFSSSCVYPHTAPQPFDESQLLQGLLEPEKEGYGLAKISTQKLTEFASKQFGLNYRTLIPSNLYGPRDNFNPRSSHMFASILFKLRKAKNENLAKVEIWGDGTARREFTYVGDLSEWVAREAINLLHIMPDSLNVGYGSDHTVSDYYLEVADALSYEGEFEYLLDKPSGIKQRLMNSKNANSIGWKAKTDLGQGITLTLDWMDKYVTLME